MGLLFDKTLSFVPHIKSLKAKCLKALDILKVLSNTNWGGDRSVLLNLYRSLVKQNEDSKTISERLIMWYEYDQVKRVTWKKLPTLPRGSLCMNV